MNVRMLHHQVLEGAADITYRLLYYPPREYFSKVGPLRPENKICF